MMEKVLNRICATRRSLPGSDSLLVLYYDLEEPEQLLLDEELRERFVNSDFKVMRAAMFTTCIPPPTNEFADT